MDGAVELNAPVKVGTVSRPRIFETMLFPPPVLWGALLLRPPGELASLTKSPRVLVAPLGSTSRIEELVGCTELMLTFGIFTYPGLSDFSCGGVWLMLLTEAPSRNMRHTEVAHARAFMQILQMFKRMELWQVQTRTKAYIYSGLE